MNTDIFTSDATLPTMIVAAHGQREMRPHFLEQVGGAGAPRRIPLDQPTLVIGRAEDAGIVIPSAKVSRQHATLVRSGVEYQIFDNGSRNGIFLNGLRIHSAMLRDGDVLQVVDNFFRYYEG